MGIYRGPNLISDGLIGAFDDGSARGYTGTGTSGTDVLDGTSITGAGTIIRDSDGYLYFNGTNTILNWSRSFTDQTDLTKNVTSSGTGGGQEEYTIEAWIRMDTGGTMGDTTSGWQIVGNNSSVGIGIQVMLNGGLTKINFGYRTNSNVYCATCDLNRNEWYHIVGTRIVETTTAYHRIYINAVQDYEGTGDTTLDVDANTANMYLGRTAARITGYFKGNLPVVRLYNKGLTAAQVLQNYNEMKPRFGL